MQYSQKDISSIEEANVVSDLPDKIINDKHWNKLKDVEIPEHLKDMIEKKDLEHRHFNDTLFWQKIPYFKNISKDEFMDVHFQNQNSVTKVDHLDDLLDD